MKRSFLTFVFLLVFWSLLAGWETFLTVEALVVVGLCAIGSWFLLRHFPSDKPGRLAFFPLFPYVLRLMGNIIVSGFRVSWKALGARSRWGAPIFVPLYVTHKTDHGRLTHAYAITLTPGTFVIDVYCDGFLIHGLDASFVSPDTLKQDALHILIMEKGEKFT